MRKTTLFLFLALLLLPGPFLPVELHAQSLPVPELERIWEYRPPLVTTVCARDGQVMGYLYHEKRFLKDLEDMPEYLVLAFLAAEDASFYEHEGIDLTAIFRAFSRNIQAGSIVQGGSTITQQLVKRLLLTSERSYARKLKEAILAYRLEKKLSKDRILEIYLNDIFMGAGAYGVEAAAQTYFGKHVEDLSLAEAALLAGLPKAPSSYNPYQNPEAALERQHYVLGRLLDLGWISQENHDQALSEELVFTSVEDPSWTIGAWYLEEVRRQLVEELSEENMKLRGVRLPKYGEDALYELGLTVYTAMDVDHQLAAEAALRQGLEDSSKRRGWQGPLANLAQEEQDPFLASMRDAYFPNQALTDIETGQWIRVLVTSVDKNTAQVMAGPFKGTISVSTMGWCRTPNPKVAPENAATISDARKVLEPGDVVWASVSAINQDDQTLQLALEQKPIVQGALVSIEPPTGEVVALVGGYDFADSQFNRATQARRQPGSAFKPIVYSAALDNGFTPASVIDDQPQTYVDPTTLKVWEPKNFSGRFYGPTLLRTALAKSRNLVTIQVAEIIGLDTVIRRAKALRLEPDFPRFRAVSLGSEAVTPINLCQAYTAFASNGRVVTPRLVLSVLDNQGQEIIHTETSFHPAISAQNAFIMAKLLQEVVSSGTGSRASALGRPLAGKTGTTNDEQDAWFIGFSPYLLTGVYVGFDQVQPMGKLETGSRAALPVFVTYRKQVEDKYEPEDFPQPGGVVFETVDEGGGPAGPWSAERYYLPFFAGTQPSLFPEVEAPINVLDEELFKQFF